MKIGLKKAQCARNVRAIVRCCHGVNLILDTAGGAQRRLGMYTVSRYSLASGGCFFACSGSSSLKALLHIRTSAGHFYPPAWQMTTRGRIFRWQPARPRIQVSAASTPTSRAHTKGSPEQFNPLARGSRPLVRHAKS